MVSSSLSSAKTLTPQTANGDAQAYDELIDWVRRGDGGYVGSVRVGAGSRNDVNERGIFATDTLHSDEVVIRIPSSHVLTARRARAEDYVGKIFEASAAGGVTNEEMPDVGGDNAALILYLLAELSKGTKSFWRPWFNSLPQQFVTLLTCDEGQFENKFADILDGTPALPFATQLREELKDMYEKWIVPFVINGPCKELFDENVCTYRTFLYVHAILESRAFKLADRPDDILLAPLADMLNHACESNGKDDDSGIVTPATNSPTGKNMRIRGWKTRTTRCESDEAQQNKQEEKEGEEEEDDERYVGLEVVGCKLVSSRTELHISYGSLANWELLVHFGFTLRGNRDDGIAMQVDMDTESENNMQLEMKRMIALELHAADVGCGCVLTLENPLPVELLTGARIVHATEDELEMAARKDYSQAVSEANEKRVRKWIGELLDDLAPPEEEEGEEEDEAEDGDNDEGEEEDTKRRRIQEDEDMKRLVGYCKEYVAGIREIVERAKAMNDANVNVKVA